MTKNIRAFTLIELLVVVLIIGILAAVALPQYQKAVEKNKAAPAISVLKSTYQAYQVYRLANGAWPTSFDQLDINIPWEKRPDLKTSVSQEVRANGMWRISLNRDGDAQGINVRLLNGQKYAGGTFYIWYKYGYGKGRVPVDTILCGEVISQIPQSGDYCQKIWNGKKVYETSSTRYFTLP